MMEGNRNMSRSITLAATLAIVIAAASTASAQVVAYHHRSTVLGDHFAGASELVRANGQFLRDEADSAETWVRVAAATDDLYYQRAERHFQVKQMELQYRQQRLLDKQQRQAADSAARETAALKMLEQIQRGGVQWPAALNRQEYAASMSLIESILRNWSPGDPSSDVYRRSLATEAGVLRARISNNKTIDHDSRLAAVRTIKQVQLLASMTGEGPAASRLAMR
jgi:hypothetical protein